MTYLMYMLGNQTLFGDGGGKKRRGEGCYVITTNSVVHSRLRFHSYG